MNFKPTPLKSIVSLISGILVGYLVGGVKFSCADCQQPTWIETIFDPNSITLFLIVMALVYLIWSLIQKK